MQGFTEKNYVEFNEKFNKYIGFIESSHTRASFNTSQQEANAKEINYCVYLDNLLNTDNETIPFKDLYPSDLFPNTNLLNTEITVEKKYEVFCTFLNLTQTSSNQLKKSTLVTKIQSKKNGLEKQKQELEKTVISENQTLESLENSNTDNKKHLEELENRYVSALSDIDDYLKIENWKDENTHSTQLIDLVKLLDEFFEIKKILPWGKPGYTENRFEKVFQEKMKHFNQDILYKVKRKISETVTRMKVNIIHLNTPYIASYDDILEQIEKDLERFNLLAQSKGHTLTVEAPEQVKELQGPSRELLDYVTSSIKMLIEELSKDTFSKSKIEQILKQIKPLKGAYDILKKQRLTSTSQDEGIIRIGELEKRILESQKTSEKDSSDTTSEQKQQQEVTTPPNIDPTQNLGENSSNPTLGQKQPSEVTAVSNIGSTQNLEENSSDTTSGQEQPPKVTAVSNIGQTQNLGENSSDTTSGQEQPPSITAHFQVNMFTKSLKIIGATVLLLGLLATFAGVVAGALVMTSVLTAGVMGIAKVAVIGGGISAGAGGLLLGVGLFKQKTEKHAFNVSNSNTF